MVTLCFLFSAPDIADHGDYNYTDNGHSSDYGDFNSIDYGNYSDLNISDNSKYNYIDSDRIVLVVIRPTAKGTEVLRIANYDEDDNRFFLHSRMHIK